MGQQSLSHARQAVDDGIGLVHDKLEKVGKGIGNALGNIFGGFGGPSSAQKAPSKPAPGKSAPLYFKGGLVFFLSSEGDLDIELESHERAGGSCLS